MTTMQKCNIMSLDVCTVLLTCQSIGFLGFFFSAVFIASVLLSVIDADRPNEHISTSL